MKRTNMKRNALAIVLTLAMVMTFVPTMAFAAETDTAAPKTTMTDVTGHWAEKAITKWADYGVLKGDDRGFRPQDSITRAEVATVIDNMMDFQVAAKNTFSDVADNAWYADAVLKANAAGVLAGADGKAMPADKITREQAAVMLARSFAVEANKGASTKFADAAQISAWAKELVYGMEAAGFVNGNNGNFNPKSFITRAELVTIIDNAVKNYHNVAGTYSTDVAGLTIVSAPNVILKGETLTGNLIIAEGVAKGDFTLDNVKVQGDLIVRGGGENSVKVTGGSTVSGTVVLEKVGDKVRITTTDNNGVALGTVEVASGNVVLDGKFGKVSVIGNVEVSVAKGTTVDSLTVAKDAAGTKVAVAEGATVSTLTMDAKTTVDNKGTITTAKANVSGIVLGGTAPKTTEVPKGIDVPKNDKGDAITGTTPPPSTGGGGGGGGSTIQAPTMKIKDVTSTAGTVVFENDTYTIPSRADENNTKITVEFGSLANVNYSATMTIKNQNTTVAYATTSGLENKYLNALSNTEVSFKDIGNMFDRIGNASGWYINADGTPGQIQSGKDAFETAITEMFGRMGNNDTYSVTITLTPVGGNTGEYSFKIKK